MRDDADDGHIESELGGVVHDETVADDPIRIEPGTPCIRCTYDLVGLTSAGACPECGTPVAETLRQGLFSGADLAYLRRIRRGLSLVLGGICTWLMLVIGSVVANAVVQFGMVSASPGGGFTVSPWMLVVQIIGTVAIFVSLMIVLWGYWRFTEPDPDRGPPGRRLEPASRLVLRWATGVHAVAAFFSTASGVISSVWSQRMISQMGQNPGVNPWCRPWSPSFWSRWSWGCSRGSRCTPRSARPSSRACSMCARLALRVPDLTIHSKAKSRMIACPIWATVGILLLGIGPLIALILYWNLLNALKKRMAGVIAARSVTA